MTNNKLKAVINLKDKTIITPVLDWIDFKAKECSWTIFSSATDEFDENVSLYDKLIKYTGLKDKNKKEIYEGDIVKIPDNYNKYGLFAGEVREVYFAFGAFRLKPIRNENVIGNHLEDNFEFEIIGNIFENPELLNKGK